MDKDQIDSLLDPVAIARAETLGLNARYIVEGYMAGEHKSPYRGFASSSRSIASIHTATTLAIWIGRSSGAPIAITSAIRAGDQLCREHPPGRQRIDEICLGQTEPNCNTGRCWRRASPTWSCTRATPRPSGCLTPKCAIIRRAAIIRRRFTGSFSKLAAFEPRDQTNIANVLHDMARQIRRKGIVILISDFFDDEQGVLDGIQHLRFGGNEVIVFHTLDPYELEFPFMGLVEFEGLEGAPKLLTRPSEIRRSYLREMEAFRLRLRDGCEKNQCHYVAGEHRPPAGRRPERLPRFFGSAPHGKPCPMPSQPHMDPNL